MESTVPDVDTTKDHNEARWRLEEIIQRMNMPTSLVHFLYKLF